MIFFCFRKVTQRKLFYQFYHNKTILNIKKYEVQRTRIVLVMDQNSYHTKLAYLFENCEVINVISE